jgi:hypothetical protein
MMTRMPDHIADELHAARRTAVNWLKLQYEAGLNLVNTGKRDHCPYCIYRERQIAGNAALKRIEQIKQDYPTHERSKERV